MFVRHFAIVLFEKVRFDGVSGLNEKKKRENEFSVPAPGVSRTQNVLRGRGDEGLDGKLL